MQLKKEIKIMLGCLRRADQDFKLIEEGDRIAVGISGGKDSLALLYALTLYRRFSKKAFELQGITISMGMQPFDLSGVRAFCSSLDIGYTVVETQIGRIIFNERQEKIHALYAPICGGERLIMPRLRLAAIKLRWDITAGT